MTNAVLGAIKKFSDPTKRVMPITAEMIYLIASLPLQGWDDEVFQLACLLGFFFLLRVGEFAETADYPSGGGGVRQLTMGDLEFFDADNNPITIESEADVTRARWLHLKVKASKGDQMWLGCLRLAEATGRIDCVVQRAARFVLLAGRRGQLHSEPLLQRSTGSVPRTAGSGRPSRPSSPRSPSTARGSTPPRSTRTRSAPAAPPGSSSSASGPSSSP